MNDLASAGADIQTELMEIIAEGISGGLLIYDKNDLVIFASQQLLGLLSVPQTHLMPGTRLRDFWAAIFDAGGRFAPEAGGQRRMLSREAWVADQVASQWKERSETVERRGYDRWISLTKRRLPSGFGICIVKDVSDQRKREDQWRSDIERVKITEEVLDSLPFPIMVKDSNLVYVAVNKAACRFHNLPPEVLLGHTGADVHSRDLEDRLDTINRNIIETGERVKLAERLTRADGSQMVIVANKFRIGKAGDHYLVTAMQDISDLVEEDEDGRAIVPLATDEKLYTAVLRRRDYDALPDGGAPADHSGRQVLLVSADPRLSVEALEFLRDMRLDVSSVETPQQAAECLVLAAELGIRVDLVLVDLPLAADCAALVENGQVPLLPFERGDVGPQLATRVSMHLRSAADTSGHQADWRIVENEDGDHDRIDVLVAEDNEVNQIVFSQIIEGLGYRYAIAADGEEAVRLWQEHRPALVLMDITLPKLNGFEAARAIRANETGRDVPIIGVLPQAFEKDRADCMAAGMDDIILKPISPDILQGLFERVLGEKQLQASHV